MKLPLLLVIIVLIFVAQGQNETLAKACNGSCFLGICRYNGSEQACNRCGEFGGDVKSNCGGNVPSPSSHGVGVIEIDTILPSGAATYKFKYGYCKGYSIFNAFSSDGCSNLPSSDKVPFYMMEDSKIVSNINDCNGSNLQSFGNATGQIEAVKNKICLVNISREDIHNNGYKEKFPLNEDTDTFRRVVCAFHVNQGKKQIIGCVPKPEAFGPPPFAKGIIPQISAKVPDVDPDGVISDSKFDSPIGIVTFDESTILRLKPLQEQDKCHVIANGKQQFCANISSDLPDLIRIKKGEQFLGYYPRIAMKKRSSIAIIPCYSTYVNDRSNNMHQAIKLLRINAQVGDEIGSTSDGKKYYLGKNYLLSESKENDSNAQCKIDNDKIMLDGAGVNINPTFLGLTIDEKEDTTPFLRPSMFDEDEELQKCEALRDQDEQSYKNCLASMKNPSYKPEVGVVEDYKIKLQAIIPSFTENIINSIKLIQKNDNTYVEDDSGDIYILQAGKRDLQKDQCGSMDKKIKRAICYAPYQGPEENWKQNDGADRICMITASNWDFVSGTYAVCNQNNSSNKEAKYCKDRVGIPTPLCTRLPDCSRSLSKKTTPNIGQAVWDNVIPLNDNGERDDSNKEEFIKFGIYVEGRCDEKEYFHRYNLDEYGLNIADSKAENELQNLVKKAKEQNKPYISINDIKSTVRLGSLYNESKDKLLVCKKIMPRGRCIGGIYGDVDANPQELTSCVKKADDNDVPILCTDGN